MVALRWRFLRKYLLYIVQFALLQFFALLTVGFLWGRNEGMLSSNQVFSVTTGGQSESPRAIFLTADMAELHAQSPDVEQLVAFSAFANSQIEVNGERFLLKNTIVSSANALQLLETMPIAGQGFPTDPQRLGQSIMISKIVADTVFAAPNRAVGKKILVEFSSSAPRAIYTVAGVYETPERLQNGSEPYAIIGSKPDFMMESLYVKAKSTKIEVSFNEILQAVKRKYSQYQQFQSLNSKLSLNRGEIQGINNADPFAATFIGIGIIYFLVGILGIVSTQMVLIQSRIAGNKIRFAIGASRLRLFKETTGEVSLACLVGVGIGSLTHFVLTLAYIQYFGAFLFSHSVAFSIQHALVLVITMFSLQLLISVFPTYFTARS
jgi:ABC-type antimicrobial peptide transport system permease subunit